MAYDWRYISSYRLNKDDLEKYLKKKFGNWDFYIEVGPTHSFAIQSVTEIESRQHTKGDRYKFWIERALTKVSFATCMDVGGADREPCCENRLKRTKSWICGALAELRGEGALAVAVAAQS
jgi:hypothetical protein